MKKPENFVLGLIGLELLLLISSTEIECNSLCVCDIKMLNTRIITESDAERFGDEKNKEIQIFYLYYIYFLIKINENGTIILVYRPVV